MSTRSRSVASGGLTLIEIVVVVVVVVIAAALLLMPAVRVQRRNHRVRCADNLKQIYIAAFSYMEDDQARASPLQRETVRPTSVQHMPHVSPTDEADDASDSRRAFELLVQLGYVDDPSVFVCSSSDGSARELTPSERENLRSFSGFTSEDQLSYGWSRAARSATTPGDAPIAADRAIRDEGGAAGGNHFGGRNVLRFEGRVEWIPIEDASSQQRVIDEVNVDRQPGVGTGSGTGTETETGS